MQSARKSLVRDQQALIERIYFSDVSGSSLNSPKKDGIAIYQSNLLSTATRSLLVTYPVLTKLLGEVSIRYLASRLLRTEPPSTGDWGDWGQGVNESVAASTLAEDYPFLQDIALLEWALHQSGRCLVQPMDMQSLTVMQGDRLLNTSIQLSPCVKLLKSSYPVDDIWRAHQTRSETAELDEALLASAIARHQGTCRLIVYQHNQLPQIAKLTELEYHWLSDVSNQFVVGELIDKYPQLDFINWLAKAIELNWISGLKPAYREME